MNRRGHPQTLVASHPGNLNAVKTGVYSDRLIRSRAAEIEADLTTLVEPSPSQRVAIREVSRSMALLEAIDDELDRGGLVDRRGNARNVLELRSRVSRQLERWLDKLDVISPTSEPPDSTTEKADIVHELERIGLSKDPRAKTQHRLMALRMLLPLVGSNSPPEIDSEEQAMRERERRAQLDKRQFWVELEEAQYGSVTPPSPPPEDAPN
jgi:hypothetical protein